MNPAQAGSAQISHCHGHTREEGNACIVAVQTIFCASRAGIAFYGWKTVVV
jgi:hypothetical protein